MGFFSPASSRVCFACPAQDGGRRPMGFREELPREDHLHARPPRRPSCPLDGQWDFSRPLPLASTLHVRPPRRPSWSTAANGISLARFLSRLLCMPGPRAPSWPLDGQWDFSPYFLSRLLCMPGPRGGHLGSPGPMGARRRLPRASDLHARPALRPSWPRAANEIVRKSLARARGACSARDPPPWC